MRVARCWRQLQVEKFFGRGYHDSKASANETTLFCAACPQPGVNMPVDWETDPRS